MQCPLGLAVVTLTLGLVGCTAVIGTEPLGLTTAHLDDPPVPDADRDGVPDALDCDPQSSKLGKRLVEDDLATAKGLVAAAQGFSGAAWRHDTGAFRQRLVRDAADAAVFAAKVDGDVLASVTASITKTDDDLDEPLDTTMRQTMLLVGTTDEAADFYAYGCGVELLGDVAKASLVKLSGTSAYVKTSAIKRVSRDYVEVGEDFDIQVKVADGTLTCIVTQAGKTSTIVEDVDGVTGSVGLFTRQVAAAFKSARICDVNPTTRAPGTSAPAPATTEDEDN